MKSFFRNSKEMAFVLYSFFTFFICTILVVTGLVQISFFGFGVDSSGKLYIGRDHRIEVYENGKIIHVIRKGTSRAYSFTIQEDDTILLASGSDVFVMDLNGTVFLDKRKDDTGEIGRKLDKVKYEFVSVDGNFYSVERPFGFFTIYQGDIALFRMPVFDYVVMILLRLSSICFIVSIFIIKESSAWLYRK